MSDEYQQALRRFEELLDRARETDLHEPAAMTLATLGGDGRLSARVVLLRGFDARGFVFYTNLHSDKARQLQQTQRASLCFHWDALREQVRIEGTAEQIADEEADEYWRTRPRDSQIGAWASRQSETLDDRQLLESRVARFEQEFAGQDVPRPEFWSGFRVVPARIEFWKAQPARLHERIVYEQTADGWTRRLLYP